MKGRRATRGFPVVRTVLVAGLALAGAVQVVRTAVVQHSVATDPDLAAAVWPGHPRVAFALTMAEIGEAANAGQAPSAASLARSLDGARRAPLAIEPFLIYGAIAQHEQRDDLAERLFLEAARRDPRSAAARYFLSQRYLSTGRPGEGLRHAAVLVRLVPGGFAALVPAVAEYARSPDAVTTLRKMFAGDRRLRDAVLAVLARDVDNYRLIIALAGDDIGTGEPPVAPVWQGQLLRALIERGDFSRAHALWLRISGLRTAPAGLFNPQFARLAAPAPFNWSFGSGDFGFAEPAARGGLQIIYYGRANAQFASQTLLLAPGTYELRMRVTRDSDGDEDSGLAWSVACSTGNVLATIPLGAIEGAALPLAGQFVVPAGCKAQTIRLAGTMRDYASSEQVTINDLQLVRLTP